MSTTLTPDQYVARQVLDFPSLYGAQTPNQSKFRVFDQLFNTIGNGIDGYDDLLRRLQVPVLTSAQLLVAQEFMNDGRMSYGYHDCYTEAGSQTRRHVSGADAIVVLARKKHLYPEVCEWLDFSNVPPMRPYPNFKREYSLVYQVDFMALGAQWIEAAMHFYSECASYFYAGSPGYPYMFPTGNENKDARTVDDYASNLQRYKSQAEISRAYGLKFTGDIPDFISRRWQKDLKAILGFIHNTLQMLSGWLVELGVTI